MDNGRNFENVDWFCQHRGFFTRRNAHLRGKTLLESCGGIGVSNRFFVFTVLIFSLERHTPGAELEYDRAETAQGRFTNHYMSCSLSSLSLRGHLGRLTLIPSATKAREVCSVIIAGVAGPGAVQLTSGSSVQYSRRAERCLQVR